MLTLAGDKDGAAKAKAIVALETELAKIQWSKVELRDPVKAYNKVEIAKLGELTPGYDWNAYLDALKITGKVNYVIVSQPTYLKGFNDVLAATPLDTWKAYFQWHAVRANAAYLSKAFVDENFAFYGTVLSGAKEQRPRWKRGVVAVEGALGEAVGKVYVEQHFPAERKARMEALVKNLLVSYKQSIDKLDWMSPATKKQAQAKLAKFTTKIGYPNKWRDYSALTIVSGDLAGNMRRSAEFSYKRNLAKLGAPVDRPAVTETTALGAAYLAGLQAGLLPPPGDAPTHWRLERRFLPNMTRSEAAERKRMTFADFGITPIINAYGTNTRLSAGPLSDEVAEAMRMAATASVDILDLQAAAC
eukprot:gene46464-56899_t